ncbi:MAG: hypothetical protein Q4F41_00360 [Eubacteriales bacterium]|nr:hypothetical protein [Eubacteriales bacterium]
MKNKYIAVLTGIVLGVSSMGSCYAMAAETENVTEEAGTEAAEQTEAESESESTDGGTAAGEENPDGESADGETASENAGDGSAASEVPEKPDGEAGEMQSGEEPPEMPEGEMAGGEALEKPEGEMAEGEEPPEKPDGEMANGEEPPEKPDGEMAGGEMPDGEKPDGEMPGGGMPGGQGGPGGASSGVESYDSVTEYTEDASSDGETFTSTGTDENAVHVSGGNVTITNATVDRTSSESTGGDNSSFYGVGAAMLVTDGTLNVDSSTITTDAAGGAGVFAYGSGVAYVSDTMIQTTQDTSGGIHAAGGGTLYAWDLDVETNGESAAAIRSDRGGGTMVVNGGTYTSNGLGSPALYSTADIAVNNAELTANGSEAVCIEGLNSLRLFDCDLTGNMSDLSQNDCTWNVILYQSMSGDSEIGNSTFEMNGGTLTAQNGGMFYTTNTESTFILSGVDITYAEDSEYFLRCTGNANERGWGETGKNGADCIFTGIGQVMQGDVIWDSISNLDFYLTDGSSLTGAVLDDETNAGEGGDGYCSVYLDEDSTWVVTGDSTVTNLYNAGTITDEAGNVVTILGADGTVYVEGTSDYTITVGTYSDTADVSGAAVQSAWEDYEVEKADQTA